MKKYKCCTDQTTKTQSVRLFPFIMNVFELIFIDVYVYYAIRMEMHLFSFSFLFLFWRRLCMCWVAWWLPKPKSRSEAVESRYWKSTTWVHSAFFFWSSLYDYRWACCCCCSWHLRIAIKWILNQMRQSTKSSTTTPIYVERQTHFL